MLTTATFIELLFGEPGTMSIYPWSSIPSCTTFTYPTDTTEGVVDAYALDIEWRNGIDLEAFWTMWEENAEAFWSVSNNERHLLSLLSSWTQHAPTRPKRGLAIMDSFMAILITLYTFRIFPTYAFCTSPTDACTCHGGGFQIYEPFCGDSLLKSNGGGNNSNNSTPSFSDSNATTATVTKLKLAKEEYPGLFEALAGQTTIILVSISVLILVVVIFTFARVYIAYIQAGDAKVAAERDAAREREQNLKLCVVEQAVPL